MRAAVLPRGRLNSAPTADISFSHAHLHHFTLQVKPASLKKYVDVYDVNVRNDVTPHELAVAVAR